jgi:hypothetical protein
MVHAIPWLIVFHVHPFRDPVADYFPFLIAYRLITFHMTVLYFWEVKTLWLRMARFKAGNDWMVKMSPIFDIKHF